MNTIELEQQSIILSTETINKLFNYKNWSDLVALYLFYHKQCKLQKTNQSFTTCNFAKKWLWRWDKRFKTTKKILKDLDLIEDIQDRDDKWVIKWRYIKIKYLKSVNKATLSTSAETHPLAVSTSGHQDTNALSSININALSSYNNKEQTLNKNNLPFKQEEKSNVDIDKEKESSAKEKENYSWFF
jgi:hypothetical protein